MLDLRNKSAYSIPTLFSSTGTQMPSCKKISRARCVIAGAGIIMALPFFVWLPLGMLETVPSMVDIYGVSGLRIPASITVAGLLVAAVALWET